jgi:broad specificity phosphatase PhoE
MDNEPPIIYIARHGETAWTTTGQHMGLRDLPLAPEGEVIAVVFYAAALLLRSAESSPRQ